MSKAIQGAAMLAGAVGMGAAAFLDPELVASPLFDEVMKSLVIGGVAMEAGAIAQSLMNNRGMGITTRQPAAFRRVIYGEQRVGGINIYRSTTGSRKTQFNYVIVIAGHEIDSIVNLYLDGRQVYWDPTNTYGNTTRNGVNFGGNALGGNYVGPGGQWYDFGGLVYCEARFGDQLDGDVITGLTANDPNWAATSYGSPWLGGCAYVYLKVEYHPGMFPSEPQVRFTVRGKNNIYDPRLGSNLRVFTNNWALVVADVLTDPIFGLGDTGSVNVGQLIAAANVCDEQIDLAIGGTESQYCCDWAFDTGTSPGDVLQTMMPAAVGRLSRIGGEWYIWPAYWQGPSFSFDEGALTADMEWTPYRPFRSLVNRVSGTYIAPNSPWNVAGDLYDSNGWYNGTIANQFPFAFTPTNYPEYAQDALHGFPEDAYLIADGGTLLPLQLVQNCVLSVSQAQRCAKITLERNRQQGSGTFEMNLAAWQMQPLDVMQFTFAPNGWSGKLLEVTEVQFRVQPPQGDGDAPSVRCTFSVQETATSVYEWSTAEDLSVYDVPSNPAITPYTPAAPTGLTAVSSAATALIGADGVVTPRILASWTAPADVLVTEIQIQYQLTGASSWTDAGVVAAATTSAYIEGVVAGQTYNVQVAGLRANGAESPWTEVTGVLVAAPDSLRASYTNSPAIALSQPSATSIAMAAVAVTFGAATVDYAARTFTIPTPTAPTWYYVTIADPLQQGESGSPTLTATCQTSQALVGIMGNTYMGAILALPGGSAFSMLAGGWPSPQTVQVGP